MRTSSRRRLATTALLLVGACTSNVEPLDITAPTQRSGAHSDQKPVETPEASEVPGLILSSSFDGDVCGFWQHPPPECEFGVQGEADTGEFAPRTGSSAMRLQRMSDAHMGVIANQPLPEGSAFVGVAHRVPELNPEDLEEAGRDFIQLEQFSPTDGILPGWPMEVRLHLSRRLGLALYGDGPERQSPETMTKWRVPVDEWFYLVVQVSNGSPATQRMWVYDQNDELVDKIEASLVTESFGKHPSRTAQKIGGTLSTMSPMYTFHDDFYIANENLGPLHIAPDGSPER